jgi:predicted MFS family arabinose efflux permease
MPAGILPQIGAGMSASEVMVGQFVIAYALGTFLVTIPASVLTRGFRRKPFPARHRRPPPGEHRHRSLPRRRRHIAARFVAGGLPGCCGDARRYTVKITPPALAGRALSLVAVGITFGTPLGTWLGITFGWRCRRPS